MPGPKPTYTERLQVLLDPPLREALDAYTIEAHTKAAQVIRAALREYLAKQDSNKVAARVTVPGGKSEGRKNTPPPDTRTPEQKRDDFYRANMAKGKK